MTTEINITSNPTAPAREDDANFEGSTAVNGVPAKSYLISVNRKPVEVGGPLITGLEIKKKAIEQGVAIDLDFKLAKVNADGKQPTVGDSEKVDVREFKTFFATAGDDNS